MYVSLPPTLPLSPPSLPPSLPPSPLSPSLPLSLSPSLPSPPQLAAVKEEVLTKTQQLRQYKKQVDQFRTENEAFTLQAVAHKEVVRESGRVNYTGSGGSLPWAMDIWCLFQSAVCVFFLLSPLLHTPPSPPSLPPSPPPPPPPPDGEAGQ